MTVLVIVGVVIAKIYYGNVNASEDPRVIEAKQLYKKYNVYTENNDYKAVFQLLDSIKDIYSNYYDYQNSFEVGVIYNNIGATWLSSALFESGDSLKMPFLDSAKKNIEKSIIIYESWLAEFNGISEKDIYEKVNSYYNVIDEYIFENKDIEKIKKKRLYDILDARIETKRRLSVAYTNLGIISRHNMLFDEAIYYYKKALTLWEDNLTAKNNINVLLGRDREERSTIDKLFPKEK